MLKKTVTYEDFNGDTVTEEYFFHLSKAELVELEMSHDGGLSAALQRIVAAEDGKQIIAEFKNIILSAYGKRSDDGRRFVKNQQLRDEFESTEAYSTIFMELVTDADAASDFINGVVPAGMVEEAAKLAASSGDAQAVTLVKPAEDTPKAPVEYISRQEMQTMSPEELRAVGVRIGKGEVEIGES